MDDLRAEGSVPETADRVAADEAWVIRRAAEVTSDGSPGQAGELVRDAMGVLGRRPDLLWVLADAEFADGDLAAGREHLDEAVAAGPRDAASVARQVGALSGAGFWRDALAVVRGAGELRRDPLVRTAAGNFFRACRCPAHAADSYGPAIGLDRAARMSRRWCWLSSGGPSGRLRHRAEAQEETSLQELLHPPAYMASLSSIDGLDVGQVRRVRAQLETNGYRYIRRWHLYVASHRLGYRLIPLAVVPVWLVLLAAVALGDFNTGTAGAAGFAAVAAVITTILVIAVVRALLRRDGRYREGISGLAIIVFLSAVIPVEAAAAEAYAHSALPSSGLPAAVVLGLVAAPAAITCLPVAFVAVFFLQDRWVLQTVRQDRLVQIIDLLLNVRHDLRSEHSFPSVQWRLRRCQYLEVAARRLTRDLLPESSTSYLGSGEWMVRRAAGWAEAVRHMQRQLIAPVPSSQGKVEALLAHEIRCLVTGNLGALAWREPPPPPPRRATLRRRAVSAIRAILVATLPLAAVLAAQPFVHATSAVFGWARIATAVWALLYVLLSIDPAMRDKIGAARDLAGLVQTMPASASREVR